LLLFALLLLVSVDVDAPDDVDGLVIVDVPDVDACPNAALAAANEVANTSALNFQRFIDPPNTPDPKCNAHPPSDPRAACALITVAEFEQKTSQTVLRSPTDRDAYAEK
jgi:hypothetical protein